MIESASTVSVSEFKLEDLDLVVMEETFINGDAQTPKVDHLRGLNINELDVNLALAVSLHGESVQHALWCFFDTEDHDFINELCGSLDVHILISDRFCDVDDLAVVLVLDLSALVVSVIMGFTIIQVKVALSLGVIAHCVTINFETDRVLNGMKKRLAVVVEVEDGQNCTTADESSLFTVSDSHYRDIVLCIHFKLGVHVVPLGGWW